MNTATVHRPGVRRYPPPIPQGAPARFRPHEFVKEFEVAAPRETIWEWINDPRTFTDSQIWPWRVEFVDGGMETGVLNVHHGPLMSFAGVVGEIRRPAYRDLQYLYGSYALTLRWIRPTRLQFFLEEPGPGRTRLRMVLSSLVRPGLYGFWSMLLRLYWALFPLIARRAARRRLRRSRAPRT